MKKGIVAAKPVPKPVISPTFTPQSLGFSTTGGDIYEMWDAEDMARPLGGVASWASLSPSGLAAVQATAGLRPDYSPVSFNGWRPGITGDGATKFLRAASVGNQPIGAVAGEIWTLLYQPSLIADASVKVSGAYGGGAATTRRDTRRTVQSGVNRAIGQSASGSLEQIKRNDAVDYSGYKIGRYCWFADGSHRMDVDGVEGTVTSGLTFNISAGNTTLFANTSSTPGQYSAVVQNVRIVTKPLDATKAANMLAWMQARLAALVFTPVVFVNNRTTINGVVFSKSTHPATYAIQENTKALGKHQRFEVRLNDFATSPPDSNVRNRAELQCSIKHNREEDAWQSYLIRVRAGVPIGADTWNLLGQMHGTSDVGDTSGLPTYAINMFDDEHLRFLRRYALTQPTLAEDVVTVVEYDSAPIVRDRWYPIVARHRFSQNATGALEVWFDGAQIINQSGINYGYNDVVGSYWKYGVYREAAPETFVVEYANMEIGTTSLAARIGAPLPIV